MVLLCYIKPFACFITAKKQVVHPAVSSGLWQIVLLQYQKLTIMKTVFLLAALAWASATNKTFAGDGHVNPSVLHTFQSNFGKVADVKWSVVDHVYKAEFKVDDETTIAFFSPDDGALVACSRYISISELPRTLQHSLKQAAASAAITEVFEVQSDTGVDYYATVQNSRRSVVLKATATKWQVYKKG